MFCSIYRPTSDVFENFKDFIKLRFIVNKITHNKKVW